MTPRVVIDTGVVVSALLFTAGRLHWLRTAWQERAVIPVVSKATVEELVRVLGYPRFALTAEERDELLGDFLPYAEILPDPHPMNSLPTCRDPHDQKFLDLASVSRADALISGDADLLALAPIAPLPILSPAEFAATFTRGSPNRRDQAG